MRGAALPAALLFGVLALTLSFAPPRLQIRTAVLAALTAVLAVLFDPLVGRIEIAFAGCWLSLLLIALAIHLRPPLPGRILYAGGVLAGFWAGTVIAVEGHPADLAYPILALLLIVPGRLMAARGWGIALKIVSSWAIAVALFAALLPVSTAMPGYRPDHMN